MTSTGTIESRIWELYATKKFKYEDTKADVEVDTRDLKTAVAGFKSGFLDCGLETRGQETRKPVEETTIVAKPPDTPLGTATG